MHLITTAQPEKLLENGRAQRDVLDQKRAAIDFERVVKIFTPDGNATWLLAALDPVRDLHFVPTNTISAYADIALEHRRVVTWFTVP